MTPLQETLKKLFNKKQKPQKPKPKDPFVDGSFMDCDFWLDELDDMEEE